VLAASLAAACPAKAAVGIISPGDPFPDFRFSMSLSAADAAYLGVTEKIGREGFFRVEDVWGDVLVLELFNRFCFGCRQGAPVVNRAYELTASDPALSRAVRFVGVGVGNGRKTVEEFRREFDVPFPLLPDPFFSILDALGNPGGTPLTMIFRRTGGGFLLVRSRLGPLDSAENFVGEIREIVNGDVRKIISGAKPVELAPWVEKELAVPLKENEIETLVLESMDRAGYGSVGLYGVNLPDGERVFIGESGRGKAFSRIISRLPVCDVCHPVHFILTVSAGGKVVDLGVISAAGYWNRPWTDREVERMRQNILGLPVDGRREFDPALDAVTSATISSALIFDSVWRTAPVYEYLKKAGHL
jgi:hypothetical protein